MLYLVLYCLVQNTPQRNRTGSVSAGSQLCSCISASYLLPLTSAKNRRIVAAGPSLVQYLYSRTRRSIASNFQHALACGGSPALSAVVRAEEAKTTQVDPPSSASLAPLEIRRVLYFAHRTSSISTPFITCLRCPAPIQCAQDRCPVLNRPARIAALEVRVQLLWTNSGDLLSCASTG